MSTDDASPPSDSPAQTALEQVLAAGEESPSEQASEKARDLLKTGGLTARLRLGERSLQRVGGRMWDRPNLAVSERIYKRFQLDDPWAPPGTAKRQSSIGLGPVSLRFGEKRRQPAPHLKPKEPKKKKTLAEADPVAKYRRPKPTPQAPPDSKPAPSAPRPPTASSAPAKPAAPAGPTGKYAITGSSGEFGGTQKRGLVGKLPMRPDLAKDATGAASGPARGASRASASRPQDGPRTATPARGTPSVPPTASSKTSSRPQPRSRAPVSGGGGGSGGGVPLPRPKLPTPKKRRAGRFRMSPTEVRSPVVTQIVAPEPVVRASDEVAATLEPGEPVRKKVVEPEKPIDRSIPTGPMGLDDLFGSMDGGRMRVGRRKKKDSSEPS